MAALSTLGFAALANAVYFDAQTQVGGFARHLLRREDSCGFHAALYLRSTAGKLEYVLSYAGSETTEGMVDWQADIGFGGSKVTNALKIASIGSPVMALATDMLASRVNSLFLRQKANTLAFATLARQMARNQPLVLTGHSLGGGLAQMAAAYSGLPAVTFSAPTVTGVDGVLAAFLKQKPRIVNFRIKNDPVNISEMTGKRVGHVVTIMSPRSTAEAHQMGNTISELIPQGQFSVTGAKDPCTVTAAMVTS